MPIIYQAKNLKPML